MAYIGIAAAWLLIVSGYLLFVHACAVANPRDDTLDHAPDRLGMSEVKRPSHVPTSISQAK